MNNELEELKLLMEEFIKEETPPTRLVRDIENLLWVYDMEKKAKVKMWPDGVNGLL